MKYNQPLGGNDMPRFAGPGTMMRLPSQDSAKGLDACFIGVPLDIGASNRAGARFGPKGIRAESSMIRPYSMRLGYSPFDSLQVADIGDVPINTFNLLKSVDIIEKFYDEVASHDTAPLTMGGDHTIVLPILRALSKKHGPIGVVHVDAHADINDTMFGEKIAHGTPFRRMMEEGILDAKRVVQIGLRTTGYSADDFDWSRDQGFRVVQAEDCWHKSLEPLMAEVRDQMGDGPVYISFDIDGLDPTFAPGTGTMEPGGLTSIQAFEIIRGCHGMNIIGGDLVEVAPAYDNSGITAMLGANLLYEMLCALPGASGKK
ncbi:agmatinase [Cocleimonas flava]|uniref:Agmatinase n=1 Tax=Cocleimonas flava TaxID=634765 RepID=A0A4R1ET16_9GAMM|nr:MULTISPECIES: agmatinase [Cocleimonas]MEB8432652.1 agmatinase [Cocleimonas sp. KMM 6892]MEC4715511.1 agmatinase [Cocleimonas sp. KMM 6895]MEC4744871.1 agmatinase [Cocleimonas sp. KMM 6896]TCJ83062.1 agmatinase [Cocleimonas flava]